MTTMPWYSFRDGDCIQVTLQNGKIFKYRHISRDTVEVNGEVLHITAIFKSENIADSLVAKIDCSDV